MLLLEAIKARNQDGNSVGSRKAATVCQVVEKSCEVVARKMSGHQKMAKDGGKLFETS